MDVLTASDVLLFRCPLALLSWEDGRMWFFVNGSPVPSSFANDFQRGPPHSRREGIQSRLRSHTLRTFLDGMSTYLRTLRDPTGGQSCCLSLGSGPGVHLLDLLLVTPSYRVEESHKTNVRSLAFMLPFQSIYNEHMAYGASLNVIGMPSQVFSLPRSDLTDAL